MVLVSLQQALDSATMQKKEQSIQLLLRLNHCSDIVLLTCNSCYESNPTPSNVLQAADAHKEPIFPSLDTRTSERGI